MIKETYLRARVGETSIDGRVGDAESFSVTLHQQSHAHVSFTGAAEVRGVISILELMLEEAERLGKNPQ